MTRPNESGGGGMTGATGDLTPDDADQPFVPAELREMSDPDHQADVTITQGRHAPAQSGETGDPGADRPEGGPTELAGRESGYGSEHGLSPNDPAYRMESRRAPSRPAHRPEPRVGGDEVTDHDDHF